MGMGDFIRGHGGGKGARREIWRTISSLLPQGTYAGAKAAMLFEALRPISSEEIIGRGWFKPGVFGKMKPALRCYFDRTGHFPKGIWMVLS
jgi:hypothetical protein